MRPESLSESVSDGHHQPRLARVGLDYDATRRDSGGEPVGRHYRLLPQRTRLRPEAEVEPRRRAQHRRRNVVREGVHTTVHLSATHFLVRTG